MPDVTKYVVNEFRKYGSDIDLIADSNQNLIAIPNIPCNSCLGPRNKSFEVRAK